MDKKGIEAEIKEFREQLAVRKRLSSSWGEFELKLKNDRELYRLQLVKDPIRFIETIRSTPAHGAILFYGHLKFVVYDALEMLYKKGTSADSVQYLRNTGALTRHSDADALWSLLEKDNAETLATIVVILFKTSNQIKKKGT